MEQSKTEQLSVVNQQVPSNQICKVGSCQTVSEIESYCTTTNIEFIKKSQYTQSISSRKQEPNITELISATLVKICILAGIKNPIDDMTKQDLLRMLFIRFKVLSIEEIYFAFQMERYAMYDKKTDHFQLFDSNYVSEVLGKYQKYKQSKKVEYNITKDSTPQLPEFTDSQLKRIEYESIVATYERIRDEGYDFLAHLLYKRIEKLHNISINDMKFIYQHEERKYLLELKTSNKLSDISKFKEYTKQMQTQNSTNDIIRKLCRARVVIDFVQGHLATLDEFLKRIQYETD